MNAQELHKKLLSSTIGGSLNDERLNSDAQEAFEMYVKNAFDNKVIVSEIKLLYSKVSLNSIIANANIQLDGFETPVFLKIHIEASGNGKSILGDDKEYANAILLEDNGWPILAPLATNTNPDYPLLVYPRIDTLTLFDVIESSYKGTNQVTPKVLEVFRLAQIVIGRATSLTLKSCDTRAAISSPVQTLFLERFKVGGRVDQWYKDETLFDLPGLEAPISWRVIKNAKWNINQTEFKRTLSEVVESARNSLSFKGEKNTQCAVSHGDDHSGNVFLDLDRNKAILFDPAFAGENPVALCDTKALAHIGYMVMGGMYFDPKLNSPKYRYDEETNTMFASIKFNETPLYNEHEAMALSIIENRVLPLFENAKLNGADTEKEISRLSDSLSACPLLTINIPKLLDSKDGRGTGLLPLVLMLNELKGFPSIEYLSEKLNEL